MHKKKKNTNIDLTTVENMKELSLPPLFYQKLVGGAVIDVCIRLFVPEAGEKKKQKARVNSVDDEKKKPKTMRSLIAFKNNCCTTMGRALGVALSGVAPRAHSTGH